jgi:Mg2+ and Co2+ transporter CorA
MAVMAREKWSDERLDDLNARMEKGFDEVKGEIRDVKGEVSELRKEMNDRFNSVDARFDSMSARFDARFDSIQRTMVMGFVSMSATIVGALLVIQL